MSPPRLPDRRDSYSSGDRDVVEGNGHGHGRQGLDGSNAGVNTRFLAVNAPMEPIPQSEHRGGNETSAPSRASPELEVSEIQGQYHDTTSGLAFLHRACRRLSKEASAQAGRYNVAVPSQPENEDSPTLTVGDKPLGRGRQGHVEFPPLQMAKQLVRLYSDVCMATYRFLHLQTVEGWLEVMAGNERDGFPIHRGLGRAKAAIVLIMLAIAKAHEDKASGRFQMDEEASMEHTDALFSDASALVQQETASPTLESAQARLVQVLYLLTTSRFNQAWYVFGTAIQLISALGLHRRAGRKPREVPKGNYIEMQLRKRTFWSAYILDKYLGVIFGRPRHYNDEDIDQEAPDSVNDEDMTPTGPAASHQRGKKDCHVDALIYHSRIGTIISEAARTVYSIKQISHKERITAAHRLGKDLQRWRESLPPYLGSIHPSSLIPTFRRQSITLRIAYCHAIMHINRLFLLGKVSSGSEPQIREAIIAATTVLETVDEMVNEQGTIFHAFWWTHYVTFCALAIVYAWEVQSRKTQPNVVLDAGISHSELMALAEKCHKHLAQATASNSPSRRYSLILEKLRREAIRGIMPRHAPSANVRKETEEGVEIRATPVHSHATPSQTQEAPFPSPASRPQSAMELNSTPQNGFGATFEEMNWSLQEWQSEDWLNLDSMVSWQPYTRTISVDSTDANNRPLVLSPRAMMPRLYGTRKQLCSLRRIETIFEKVDLEPIMSIIYR